VSTTRFDVGAIRRRFSSLQSPHVFFDGPSGTQAPDEVIDALGWYLREANANMGGVYETSLRTTDVYLEARAAAARFLGCSEREVIFGPNMSSLNFMLSRTAGRHLRDGDEIVVTQLDHDGNVSPWLELAKDRNLVVRFANMRPGDGSLDLEHLEGLLSERTRVVAFPWAANSIGTLVDAERVSSLAHEAGALAWVDAVHYAAHGPIEASAVGADVLLCSAYKFCGPHMGIAFGRAELLESWEPYKLRPAPSEPLGFRFESGTPQYELLAGLVKTVEYIESIGGFEVIEAHETELGQRFIDGLPESCRLYGSPTMEGRLPTFAFNVGELAPADVAARLAEQKLNAGSGNYYSPGAMDALGIAAAVRIGISHYNTAEEVDRLLAALNDLSEANVGA
jgi:cysteine desulfurase family protein (TIGR01976 family)